MMFIGPVAFLIFFAFLSDTVRDKIFDFVGGASHWIDVNQPFSSLALMVVAAAALLALLLVVRWPKTPEADNPLLQYRRDHPDMMD